MNDRERSVYERMLCRCGHFRFLHRKPLYYGHCIDCKCPGFREIK